MKAAWPRVPALLLASSLLLAPRPGSAAEPEDLVGTFVRDPSTDNEVGLARAIDEAVASMPLLFRGITRRKLRKAAHFPDRFSFSFDSGLLTIASDVTSETGWTTTLDRTPLQISTHQGDPITIERWMQDGALYSLGRSKRGTHENRFALTDKAGQQMNLSVVIRNKRLARPLAFTIRYVRQLEPQPPLDPDRPQEGGASQSALPP